MIADFSYDLNAIEKAARLVISNAGKQNLWCFFGEMSAGKTTLIKEIAKQLGVSGEVNSPTFSLVNEYTADSGKTLFHFDFYRIKSIAEVYDIGYEDYFFSGNTCLIEWPEKIAEIIDNEPHYNIQIVKGNSQKERKLSLNQS